MFILFTVIYFAVLRPKNVVLNVHLVGSFEVLREGASTLWKKLNYSYV